jgi:hypothetical protein
MAGLRFTTADFIARASLLHGRVYDYSKTVYAGALVKVCIGCPKHGDFWQPPHRHLRREGCPACAGSRLAKSKRRGAAIDFPAKARDVHGAKYDYSTVTYTGNTVKVRILCPEHGPFFVTPHSHLRGVGCPGCRKRKKP